MYYIKIHKSYRNVIAICDSELIGKYFENGNFQLDVKESFYRGDKVNEEKLREIISEQLKEDSTFNIVGENSVKIALKSGIISKQGIKKISGIPFALVLL